ncbi:MAG TPA: cytochrome c, partial [Candidatus Angelobacter sp.]|nr:cytochrome c [Candidatus Angelobacter sp.]
MKFILGLIIGILILPLCGYIYFRFGYAPVATAAAPMPFEKKMASMALRAKIRAEAPKSSPIQPDEPNLTAGAKIYVVNCAFCHGLP